MLDVARDIIGSQPILTAFLAIGLGYLVGQISIAGFSLGVGAVLFVGLAIGAFAPKAQITGPIGLTGLIMFLYGIGILYGRQFFEGMVGVGQKYNLLALVACIAGLFVALGLGKVFGIKLGHTMGLYAGSMTSTATLQAALDVMKDKDPSIGYSIAYPFGVIGPILCIYFMTRLVKPEFPAKAQRFHMGEISIAAASSGRKLEELITDLPSDVQVTMVRTGGRNFVPTPDTVFSAGDAILIVSERNEAIKDAAARLGKLEPGLLASDRADLDYIRVFVGKANMVGIPLSQLPMPSSFQTHVLHVRRYDADLVPSPDLMLEFGDRIGVLTPPEPKGRDPQAVRRHREGGRRIQLRVAGGRHGARGFARPHSNSNSGRRGRDARHRWRAAHRRSHSWQVAADWPDALDDAAAGEHRLAKFRTRDVPRHRWRQRRPTLCPHRCRIRLYDALHRRRGALDHRVYRPAGRPLPAQDPL